jgi:hypothetical protein
MTDFRALCAELLQECQYLHDNNRYNKALWDRARTALAQPEPVAPTDEELETTARAAEIQYVKEHGGLAGLTLDGLHAQLQAQRLAGLRAVAARFGRPAIEPVP